MMLNSVIKKQMRKSLFSIPFSWSFVDNLEKQLAKELSTSSNTTKSGKDLKAEKKIEDNPFYSHYADKIKRVVSREGPNIAQIIEENLQKIDQLNSIPEPERIKTKSPRKKSQESGEKIGGFPHNKCLKDVVNIDLLLDLDVDNITQVWNDYHRQKSDCVYAVIPSSQYKPIYENGRQYPSYIYLLPKLDTKNDGHKTNPEDCYQIFLGQFSNHKVHFTPLISYHLHQENASPIMTLWHFPELSEKKGIVFMQGFFDSKSISSMEAQCLANQVQIYYSGHDMTRSLLLHKFNRDPKSFDYLDAIKVFEESLIAK